MESDMTRSMLIAAVFMFSCHGLTDAAQKEKADEKFTIAAVRIEQNASDKDAEIVFEAKGGKVGLATLKVITPDGRTVIDFKAPDTKLGIRHLTLESPEPKNDGSIQMDFPEGKYVFTGTTVTGVTLRSDAILSHKLPPTASLVHPRPNQADVSAKKAVIAWNSGKDLAAHVIIIEQQATGLKTTTFLPGSARTHSIPEGLLSPGTKSKLEIGTVSRDGNISFVETSFMTAAN
jgi:hypothetical protein